MLPVTCAATDPRSPRSPRLLQRRRQRLRQLLAQLHAPLIEGVDAPDHALREHLVLVQRDQSGPSVFGPSRGNRMTELGRLPGCSLCGISRAISRFGRPLGRQVLPDLRLGLSERKRLRLRETIGQRQVLLFLIRDSKHSRARENPAPRARCPDATTGRTSAARSSRARPTAPRRVS